MLGSFERTTSCPASPRGEEKIPKDFILELCTQVDTILNTPTTCPFTGRPLEPDDGSKKAGARKTKMSMARKTKLGGGGLQQQTSMFSAPAHLTSTKGVAALLAAFDKPLAPEQPTGEQLAARWENASTAAPAVVATKPTRAARQPLPAAPASLSAVDSRNYDEEAGKVASSAKIPDELDSSNPASSPRETSSLVPPIEGIRRRAVAPPVNVDEPPASEPMNFVKRTNVRARSSVDIDEPPKPQSHPNDEIPTPKTPGSDLKAGPNSRPKRFAPPASSRRAVKTLEEEEGEGISISPSQAESVDDAVDRLRDYFVERFGSARRAFTALQRAGRDPNKAGVQCGDVISTMELRNAMRRLGVNWPAVAGFGNMHKILNAFDLNKSGTMSLEDLMGFHLESSSSSSDDNSEGEEEEESDPEELTWRERRAIAEAEKLEALRKQPLWNYYQPLKRRQKHSNVVGRDILLIRNNKMHSRAEEGEMPIWQRYEATREERAVALRLEQLRRQAEELELCPFKPHIFTTGQQACMDHQACLEHSAVKLRKAKSEERMLLYRAIERGETYSFQPQICKSSRKIYKSMRADTTVPWHDRLWRDNRTDRVGTRPDKDDERFSFKPTMRARSHAPQRSERMHQRLFPKKYPADGPTSVVEHTPLLKLLLHRLEQTAEDSDEVERAASISVESSLSRCSLQKRSPRGNTASDVTKTNLPFDDDELMAQSTAALDTRSHSITPRVSPRSAAPHHGSMIQHGSSSVSQDGTSPRQDMMSQCGHSLTSQASTPRLSTSPCEHTPPTHEPVSFRSERHNRKKQRERR